MRSTLINRSLFCLGMVGMLVSSVARADDHAAVQSETLLRSATSWDGSAYASYPAGSPELTVVKITIPPNTSLPWHTHPMPNAAYILSGELTVEKKESGETKLLTAGQVLPEMVGQLHRGVTGNVPAVLIVFYAGTKDMPLSQR
jgi:quercetin dioxygenase-like cupin family protein